MRVVFLQKHFVEMLRSLFVVLPTRHRTCQQKWSESSDRAKKIPDRTNDYKKIFDCFFPIFKNFIEAINRPHFTKIDYKDKNAENEMNYTTK